MTAQSYCVHNQCDTWDAPIEPRALEGLLALGNAELARVDPLEMNLLVAKGLPALAHLDISHYQMIADCWANDVQDRLSSAEDEFHKSPGSWKNDVRFFRLGFLCWYVDNVLCVRYREDQRDLTEVWYTDPSDLFLNGVMDSRRGTCGNMASLHVALSWRLGWPVSLACLGAHFICRYDDGDVTHNIETTDMGRGGFSSNPDDYYLKKYNLSLRAVHCGSDLRAVTPRKLLGLFVGLRARHLQNLTMNAEPAEADYLLARHLFPQNRYLHISQMRNSIRRCVDLFEPNEKGHANDLKVFLQEFVQVQWFDPGAPKPVQPLKERLDESTLDAVFQDMAFQRTKHCPADL